MKATDAMSTPEIARCFLRSQLGAEARRSTLVQLKIPEYGIDFNVVVNVDERNDCDRAENDETITDLSQMEPPVAAPNEHWQWLSQAEKAVIKAFLREGDPWRSCEAIAEHVTFLNARDLAVILRNMVDRDILESRQGRGFRLKNPPKNQDKDLNGV